MHWHGRRFNGLLLLLGSASLGWGSSGLSLGVSPMVTVRGEVVALGIAVCGGSYPVAAMARVASFGCVLVAVAATRSKGRRWCSKTDKLPDDVQIASLVEDRAIVQVAGGGILSSAVQGCLDMAANGLDSELTPRPEPVGAQAALEQARAVVSELRTFPVLYTVDGRRFREVSVAVPKLTVTLFGDWKIKRPRVCNWLREGTVQQGMPPLQRALARGGAGGEGAAGEGEKRSKPRGRGRRGR